MNESIPVTIAAVCIFILGIVPLRDIYQIFQIISGASITILSTIVMSIVLDSIGFFKWAAMNLAIRAKGSGILLFWYINLLCFLMTLFFNNDGSILITTPIIIQTLSFLHLKTHQKIPYLISGALVATAASAPIGVSNLANLIALEIVKLDLNSYVAMMFVPSLLGVSSIALLLYLYYKKDIPVSVKKTDLKEATEYMFHNQHKRRPHPLSHNPGTQSPIDWKMFRLCISIVVLTRISFFALAPLGVPTEWPAVIGAVALIIVRWYKTRTGAMDVVKKSPWHIFLFAFGMYVIVYGLHNAGLSDLVIEKFGDDVAKGPFYAIFVMGFLIALLSNISNNLPSVMIGTLVIKEMGLNVSTLQIAYLANVIGADIGSLILPIGTLASLIWMYLLRQHKIKVDWGHYIRATILVIPISLIITLLGLYLWTTYFFL